MAAANRGPTGNHQRPSNGIKRAAPMPSSHVNNNEDTESIDEDNVYDDQFDEASEQDCSDERQRPNHFEKSKRIRRSDDDDEKHEARGVNRRGKQSKASLDGKADQLQSGSIHLKSKTLRMFMPIIGEVPISK